jgi:cellulose synthase/poly-beta-1,6-N-acetylglucosamine synthase-like glycosyltransferase
MTHLFWVCLALILYVYAGYPALLASGILGRRRPVPMANLAPAISVIIPAHNEEKTIQSKLSNLLSLDYPKDKLEILVGSDGSSDQTEAMVEQFRESDVRLVSSKQRIGKSAMQNELVARSSGAILVFTDADCLLAPNALRLLAQNFADRTIGLVTNCAVILNRDATGVVASEGIYWRYERWLRLQESKRGMLAMASGSLFSMRRDLWRPLDPNVGDDFVLPLQVARAGYRCVMETRTSAQIVMQSESGSMLSMKVRVISKDLRGLLKNSSCLNPFRTGRVAIGLWSHKLLRWAVPYFLIGLFASNLVLASHRPYGSFLTAQAIFYVVAVAGMLFGTRRFRLPLSVAHCFCLVNLAALLGTLHCISLRTTGQWKTAR